MRAILLLAVPLALAACDRAEVVSICAATGELDGEVTAAFFDESGARAVLGRDGANSQATFAADTVAETVLPALWRMAETTMHALPDTEPSPCGLDILSGVRVTFSDGSTLERQTTCTGNALSRVASEVLEASEHATLLAEASPTQSAPLDGILAACDRLP